jgi:hypothetical protein
MKTCKTCGHLLPLEEYYTSQRHKDGYFKECKSCLKQKASKPTPEARKRATQNYVKRHPHRVLANTRAKRIAIMPGQERHHWSYLEEHHCDVIIMERSDHRKLHRQLIRDLGTGMYRRKDTGELLDTREKHESFIRELFPKPEQQIIQTQTLRIHNEEATV